MKALPVLDSKAAGIDVGSEARFVSIGADTPKVFGTMTQDLHAVRDGLKAPGVRAVAVEPTGVYRLCRYEVLEAAGIEVVVNGRHVNNLPGHKTDMADRRRTSVVCRTICGCAETLSAWRLRMSGLCTERAGAHEHHAA